MTPPQELATWYQARKSLEAKYGKEQLAFKASPQEIDLYNGKSLSQGAHQLFYKGNGEQRFDADTGQMVNTPGYWGHPESWIQLAGGVGMGAVSVANLGASASQGAVSGGAGAFNAAGDWIPAVASGGAAHSIAAAAPLINSGIGLFGTLFGAHQQSAAAKEAAQIEADAVKYGADLQDAATKRAETFTKQQAEQTWQDSQRTEKANYDQWAAGRRYVNSAGSYLGLGEKEIPAYVPGQDPHYDSGATAPPSATGAPSSTGAPAAGGDPILAALTDNYSKLGVQPTGPGSGPTDIAYMAGKIKDTGGLTPDNIKYWFGPQGRIAAELAQAKGGASRQTSPVQSASSYLSSPTPLRPVPITPALAMPQAASSYLGA